MLEEKLDLKKMELMLSVDLQTNIDKFIIEFGALYDNLQLSGMPEAEIRKLLIADLTGDGRLFASFKNGLGRAVATAVNRASNGAADQILNRAGIIDRRWITVSSNTCPDCLERHGRVRTIEHWRTVGMPGSGFSVCMYNCKCVLVPANYKGADLEKPISRPKKK